MTATEVHLVPSTATAQDAPVQMSRLIGPLWRGKWFIALCAALAVAAAAYYAMVAATPMYRASAVVILETRQDQIVDLQSVVGGLSGDATEINSEVEVLRARSLMARVVSDLKLTLDPEFNAALRPPSPVNAMKAQILERVGLHDVTPPAPTSPESVEDKVVSALLDHVSIRNVPSSLVFRVSVESENPAKAALIADTIVEQYILNQIAVKFEATEQATLWLSDRVAELQADLETAEAAASDFSAGTDLVSVEGLRALERQIKDQRDRIETAEVTRRDIADRLARLASAETPQAQAEAAADPALMRILDRANGGAAAMTTFRTRLTQIEQRLAQDLTRTNQQLTALRQSEQSLRDQIERQGEDLITLQQLTREAEATRLLYEHFLTRLKETAAQQGIQQADSRILSSAVIPGAPSSPRTSLIISMAAIGGILFGTAVILLRAMRNTTFRTSRELETSTGLTVLGQIPIIPGGSRAKLLNYLSDKPTSATAEAVRNLRTSLMLTNVDTPPKVILSTSAIPGEGKTTNSLALAHNLVGLGKKVLLVEGDIRRRTLRKYFKGLPQRGIVSVLSGEASLQEAVYRAPNFGGDILGGEMSDTNAADLFASDRFKTLISEMRDRYDAIIIDTPPVLVVPDARILAQVADVTLLTVRWDRTSRAQVEEALRLFQTSRQKITGLVLSQINPRGMRRYGHAGTYGAYSNYGAKYYAS